MMKNISKFLLVLTVSLLTYIQSSAQDPAFSQFYANPLYLDPVKAGFKYNGLA